MKILLIAENFLSEIIVYYDRADKGLSNAVYIVIIEQRVHGFFSLLVCEVYRNAA